MRAIGRALRGLGAAVWSRPWPFCAIALGVFALDILVPPLVLTLARKPVTAFTINPVLSTLPGYVVSGPGSLGERLAKAWGLALFWFSADNSFGLEWGFAVTTADLARFAFMSLLVALYFSLWMERRARFAVPLFRPRLSNCRAKRPGRLGDEMEPRLAREPDPGEDCDRQRHGA